MDERICVWNCLNGFDLGEWHSSLGVMGINIKDMEYLSGCGSLFCYCAFGNGSGVHLVWDGDEWRMVRSAPPLTPVAPDVAAAIKVFGPRAWESHCE